ncbi:hypothetical protein FPV60_18860 [Acinetobacter colistiniresistens]|uniref:Uncharacterized protein n=1 Tax=Acinetobacter colistiniresistens TaxID=280145 RepID=A0A558EVZ6_9GAMM|nr:hypothetical protein FPV60_18860 [Acinetobacter colistiniresistens]
MAEKAFTDRFVQQSPKEGKHDLVYENNTLLKVKMISNQHIVVEDDHQTSFLLKRQDENVIWSFI